RGQRGPKRATSALKMKLARCRSAPRADLFDFTMNVADRTAPALYTRRVLAGTRIAIHQLLSTTVGLVVMPARPNALAPAFYCQAKPTTMQPGGSMRKRAVLASIAILVATFSGVNAQYLLGFRLLKLDGERVVWTTWTGEPTATRVTY